MIIFSFLFEGIISNLISLNTNFFIPCFTLFSIPYIYGKYSSKKYYIISFIVGILYDIVYSMPLFLHAILFLIISICTKKVFSYIQFSNLKLFILSFLYLCFYRIFLYFLIYFSYPLSIFILLKSITASILLNIIYIFIIDVFHKLKRNNIK